jgi:hypothetical protein
MKNKIAVIIAALSISGLAASAQTVTVTNAQTMPSFTSTTVSNVLTSVPAGVVKVASDGYNFWKTLSLTNPLSINLVGLKNGKLFGGGIEVNPVNTNSAVSAGFGLFGIQTTKAATATAKAQTSLDFYDATINLSVSQVENIPVLNIPITLRIFSGPFASLNGGVLIGEQSGVTGDVAFRISATGYLTAGGGVINCAGAAAAGLKATLPMGHIGVIWTF